MISQPRLANEIIEDLEELGSGKRGLHMPARVERHGCPHTKR